ncbi:nucleoredoxin-like protein 2 isoform X1 [Varroa destructor]|uniref:protein-disulfide reductase n=1 Tax=Varroa destructor TaxID=109461 RepID=A0A7M7KB43_VARDE|nr:nucleoredoxin-like protein 2 isoform X1 [Varroa destructor]XP_022664291.1 nucleoredoxin-like protein 2 isoform X1 [Varroa destructor]
MSPGLCACYKCVVSGRRWNLTVTDIIRDRPLVRACGSVSNLQDLFAEDKCDETNPLTAISERKRILVALYFGAAFRDSCQVFANELWIAQRSLYAAGLRLEIVYVSADRNADELFNFMKSRPQWHALRFNDPAVSELRSFLSIREVPALVVIDNVGLVARSGRRDLQTLGPIAIWCKWTSSKPASSAPARSAGPSTISSGPYASRKAGPSRNAIKPLRNN